MAKPSPLIAGTSDGSAPLGLLRRMEWRVKHAVENVLSGEYRSAFRGRGMEFDQVVKYEFGDDVRDIDWNVTARLGEPYRKKFIEEREVCLFLLFEDTPSLQFGSEARTKRECLLELAALVMLLGAVNRDRVGLLYASPTSYQFRRPVPGRQAILHSASTLLGHEPPPIDGPAKANIPWRFLARAAPRHSIFIWLGDFPPQTEPEGWTVIRRRYQAMGFRVEDPWERELPRAGALPIFDPVDGSMAVVDTRASSHRTAHAEWVRERDLAYESLFPETTNRLNLTTLDTPIDSMVSFFHRRSRQPGGH